MQLYLCWQCLLYPAHLGGVPMGTGWISCKSGSGFWVKKRKLKRRRIKMQKKQLIKSTAIALLACTPLLTACAGKEIVPVAQPCPQPPKALTEYATTPESSTKRLHDLMMDYQDSLQKATIETPVLR